MDRLKVLAAMILLASLASPVKPAPVDIGLLLASEAIIAADLLQTYDIKNHANQEESNPLLGSHPSDLRITLSGAAIMLAMGGLWVALPDNNYRRLLAVGILSCEIPTVWRNARMGLVFRVPF